MNKELQAFCEELEANIKATYESGTTLEEAERLAAKFLYAQIQVANELSVCDLDAKMKKNGVKAVRAAVYMQEATKDPKKPSDTLLLAVVDMNDLVLGEQTRYDEADSNRASLENYYNIFREAHIYYRNVSKGKFE